MGHALVFIGIYYFTSNCNSNIRQAQCVKGLLNSYTTSNGEPENRVPEYQRKRASSWLTAVPAPKHGFALHKGTRLVEFTLP